MRAVRQHTTALALRSARRPGDASGRHGAADELDDVLRRGTGAEDLGDAELLELGDVLGGDRAADDDQHFLGLLIAQQLDDPRHERHVGAREDQDADRVRVLLQRGLDDLLGRLVQAGVDDLHARVAQRAGDDLRTAVMPVQAWLGDDDADLASRAGGLHERPESLGGPARRRAHYFTTSFIDWSLAPWMLQ